jgi:hypothetical protein
MFTVGEDGNLELEVRVRHHANGRPSTTGLHVAPPVLHLQQLRHRTVSAQV